MKKTYQAPSVVITAIGPSQMIAVSIKSVEGKSGNITIFSYGGGGDGTEEHGGAARASGGSLWDEYDEE